MTDATITVAGYPIVSGRLYVSSLGTWVADFDLVEDAPISGVVAVQCGTLSLRGTVQASRSGTHALQRAVRIVGGAGGWGSILTAKGYHADNGIKALLVAQDAAREAGETLGSFAPSSPTVGIDYVRQVGPASRTLEDVIGDVVWWVDYDGVTHVGEREASTPTEGSYQVLDYDPRQRLATLAVDDIAAVGIGSVLSEGLDESQTVRELEVQIDAGRLRVLAWCGESLRGRLHAALQSIIKRTTDDQIHGMWKYRVVEVAGDRVKLQIVNRRTGLPDLIPLSMWPGVAGAHATLAPGAEVLVEFIEGDRAQPIVTHFAGKDGVGFVPVKLALCDADGTAPLAARVGDEITVTFDTGTFLTSANTPVYNTVPLSFTGTITSGSLRVAIG